jgi:MFS family permease
MIDITKHRFLQYFLFSSLYFSEGFKWSIAIVILPLYFNDIGISATILGIIIAIITLPMVLKFVFGGIIDHFIRYGRKIFVIIGGFTTVICFFILGFIDPATALIPFSIIFFIGVCGIGFLDVSADAWAIETAREDERGKINGVMFAGIFVGLSIGSLIFTQIIDIYGYSAVFFVASIIVFLIILFPLFVEDVRKVFKKKQKVGKLLLKEFKRKSIQVISIFAPISAISGGIILLLAPVYMANILFLVPTQIGMISMISPIATIIGCLLWGTIADKLGRKKTLYIVLFGSLISTAFLFFAGTWYLFLIIYTIIGFFFGGYYVVGCALLMDVTNPAIAASQFSILTALFNLGEMGIGHGLAGIMVDTLGYRRVFLYSAIFYGISILLLYFVRGEKIK